MLIFLLLLFSLRDIKAIHLVKVYFWTLFLYMNLPWSIIPPTNHSYGLIHLFPSPLSPFLIPKALALWVGQFHHPSADKSFALTFNLRLVNY